MDYNIYTILNSKSLLSPRVYWTLCIRLEGHTDEVHAVEVKGALLVSGGSDK